MAGKKKTPSKKNTAKANGAAESSNGMSEVGEIAPEILHQLNAMRSRSTELLLEAGRLEIQRQDYLNEVRTLENRSREMVRQEADRLGIKEGQQWQVTPQGKALVEEASPA